MAPLGAEVVPAVAVAVNMSLQQLPQQRNVNQPRMQPQQQQQKNHVNRSQQKKNREEDFSFLVRKRTLCIDTTRAKKANGEKPTEFDIDEFVEKDLGVKIGDIEDIMIHTFLQNVFLKFVHEERLEQVLEKLKEGVHWELTGMNVFGWRVDEVYVHVSGEVSESEVRKEFEVYGSVLDCRKNVKGRFQCTDGTVLIRIKLSSGVKLPNFLRRCRTPLQDAEIWRLVWRGQGSVGCYRCGMTGHIGRFCNTPRGSSYASVAGGAEINEPENDAEVAVTNVSPGSPPSFRKMFDGEARKQSEAEKKKAEENVRGEKEKSGKVVEDGFWVVGKNNKTVGQVSVDEIDNLAATVDVEDESNKRKLSGLDESEVAGSEKLRRTEGMMDTDAENKEIENEVIDEPVGATENVSEEKEAIEEEEVEEVPASRAALEKMFDEEMRIALEGNSDKEKLEAIERAEKINKMLHQGENGKEVEDVDVTEGERNVKSVVVQRKENVLVEVDDDVAVENVSEDAIVDESTKRKLSKLEESSEIEKRMKEGSTDVIPTVEKVKPDKKNVAAASVKDAQKLQLLQKNIKSRQKLARK